MNITGLNKAVVLAALYNSSKQQGLGALYHSGKQEMTLEEAEELISANPRMYFDYIHGHILKINLSENEVHTGLYNRDNGDGKAESIIEQLRQ
jgi:hypothetical protein